uniref:Uncharacterized protein n=1 Tax=Ignisphaera aggregans TaxID=334771 RepID=A0A7C4FF17_9CREN
MELNALRTSILDAYHRYGQRFLLVMKIAIAIAKENKLRGATLPGDFDYKNLVERLSAVGFSYNPSLLLRILEKEYRLVETSYKSSNQRWYKFKYDIGYVEMVINSLSTGNEELEDPDIAIIKIQLSSLRPKYWLNKLKNWSVKERFSKVDMKTFEEFSFSILPKFVKVLKRAEEYEEALFVEINTIKEIIQLAQLIAEKIEHGDVNNSETYTNSITLMNFQGAQHI